MNLAPNGKPSNLTPKQYALVRTPAFKAWFGDWENSPETASKVVDSNGEPLVLWHGSKSLFNEFDLSKSLLFGEQTGEAGFHFGTFSQASSRVESSKEKYFYECFLNIRNIVEVSDMVFFSKHKISLRLYELGLFTREDYINWGKFYDIIKEKKIDGLKYLNKWEGYGNEFSYNVFYPEQIKLADGTNTTFDSNNPDIRYSGGGETPYVSDDFQIGYDGAYEHLIAPNGKLSNLTPEQYALVRTPEFKAWFGDWENYPETASKVVDEETKEPLVVYHGSRFKGDIYKFEHILDEKLDWTKDSLGFYFTDDKSYAEGYGDKIYECFLNIRNPKASIKFEHTYLPFLKIQKFIYEGYDGIYFSGSVDEEIKDVIYEKEIVAFEPTQIKLADGTNTTFDSNNPDIRFAKGGFVKDYEDKKHKVEYSINVWKNPYDSEGYPMNISAYAKIIKDGNEVIIGSLWSYLWDIDKEKKAKINASRLKVFKNIKSNGYSQLLEIEDAKVITEFQRQGIYKNLLKKVLKDKKLPVVSYKWQRNGLSDAFWKKNKDANVVNISSNYIAYPKKPDIYNNGGLTIKKVLLAPNGKLSNLTPDNDGGNILTDYSNYKTSVIALFNDDKVLILKRGSTANWMPNKWSLVGGVVENDENPKEAIIRESFEEIGLMPKDVVFDNKIYSKDIGEIYYYHGYLESKSVNLDYENSEYEFISQSEIDNYEYVPYVKEYIKKLFSKGFSDLLSSQEVENKLGRKLDWWNDDVVYLSGIKYKKVYLRPEYKKI